MALNLIGEPLQVAGAAAAGPGQLLEAGLAPPLAGGAAASGGGPNDVRYYNRAAGQLADLTLDVNVDATTAARIKAGCAHVGVGGGGRRGRATY